MTDHQLAIEVDCLVRVYETSIGIIRRTSKCIKALNNISFEICRGELFGLVGPNGAGKTTLIKVLSTLLLPSSGQVRVLGHNVMDNPRPIRERINVVFGGERGLYTRLSGEDNLKYFAYLYRVPQVIAKRRMTELLDLVDLTDRRHERVEGYSRGMKQRLHIARALINDPDVLFLDEPTLGLDPIAARKMRVLINELRALKKTIILTSHYMFEVDTLCDRVAVINSGRLLSLDTPSQLKKNVIGLFVVEVKLLHTSLNGDVMNQLKALPYIDTLSITSEGSTQILSIQTSVPESVTNILREYLSPEDVSGIIVRQPTLEDAYIKLMGGTE